VYNIIALQKSLNIFTYTKANHMITKVLFFSLLLFLNIKSFSQDSSSVKKFEQRTLFQFGNRYEINGQKLKYGQLKAALNKFDDASLEYNLFHKRSVASGMLGLGGLIMEGIAFAVYKNNHQLANGLLIAAVSAFAISIPISISGKKHFQKSVWLYNRNVMAY